MKGRTVYIKTFGCQMNEHDSERILGILSSHGYSEVDEPKKADIVVFNTCAIREKAEQKFLSSLGRIKHLKRKKQNFTIIVAGCSAQIRGQSLLNKAPYIDFIIGPDNIDKLNIILNGMEDFKERAFLDENPNIGKIDLPTVRKDSVKAWVNIIYGCNNFCTYCVVPYTRGRERSRPIENIIREIKELGERGYKEVTLLGQNVNSYMDGEQSFPDLLKEINKIEGISRIRFVTSHPKDLSEQLIEVMRDCEKVCEHIHLPLQSGSDRILKLMNRKYTFGDYLKKIEMLRKNIPNISITSDIIVGFPQELDQDFEKTIDALKEIQFDGIFAFKYSNRPCAKASKLDGQIPDQIKSERLSLVLTFQDEITEKKNKVYEGTTQEVLFENPEEEGLSIGRTRTNKIVKVAEKIEAGKILNVKIIKSHRHALEGELA